MEYYFWLCFEFQKIESFSIQILYSFFPNSNLPFPYTLPLPKKEEKTKKMVEDWERIYLTFYTEENERLNRNSIGYSEYVVNILILNNNFLMYILVELMS